MAWTVGESCFGVDDNLSAAAKAFVRSELVVDLAVLWHRVTPRDANCTLANKAVHASFRRTKEFISLENRVRNSPVVDQCYHHKVKSDRRLILLSRVPGLEVASNFKNLLRTLVQLRMALMTNQIHESLNMFA